MLIYGRYCTNACIYILSLAAVPGVWQQEPPHAMLGHERTSQWRLHLHVRDCEFGLSSSSLSLVESCLGAFFCVLVAVAVSFVMTMVVLVIVIVLLIL